jgi:mono/diheme cytochrome c family protein
MILRHPKRWLAAFCLLVVPTSARAADADTPVDFARDVQPIFAARCIDCHGPAKQKGGIRLDTHTALKGGDSGEPLLVAGKPEASHLIKLVKGEDDEVMPPKGEKLSAAQVEILSRWIRQGGKWPEATGPVKVERPKHWSFQKPVRAAVPAVQTGMVRNPIDAFVLSKVTAAGLRQSPEADRAALLRRLSFDLIGLPPTPEEVDTFLADTSPDAYEKQVDRLLASPAFGERWARLWLDLARYADSKGYGSDPLRFTIHPYRDWVISAFNQNKPYDQFTIEQLAGDLLPNATQDQLIATAFHRNTMTNTEGGTDDEEFRVAAVKDRTDVTFQAWMGLTMGCAQCHTHKFDPITHREYYSAYAFFNQTEDADRADESPTIPTPTAAELERQKQLQDEIARLEAGLKDSPELTAALAKWEQSVKDPEAGWTTLKVVSATAKSGQPKLELLPDGSILASGGKSKTDTYTVVVETGEAGITAFRLEALPDESLPKKGPGRDGGNFVLNELRVSAAPANDADAGKLRGRYIRIEKKTRHLMLAEVQVLDGGTNLATGGKASQSTTGYGGDASRAIDGNTKGHYFDDASVSHTGEGDNSPWWELDLGEEKSFDRVALWNRTDGGGDKLVGAKLLVLNAKREPTFSQAVTRLPSPTASFSPGKTADIALANATESFAQASDNGWPAAKAIDGNAGARSGWAIGGGQGKRHVAVFETASPADLKQGARLTFTLEQNYEGASLGRFRLSATSRPKPVRVLPADVAAALAVDSPRRTDAQRGRIRDYFLSTSGLNTKEHARLADLQKQLSAVKPTRTAILRELPAEKQRPTNILIKGNFLQKGEPVKPGVLAAFHPLPEGAPMNRLGLAQWIVSKENPLTARVQVNRIWAAFFGNGLVETQEDFGEQGQPPSHPELLDWLAVEFMEPTHGGSGTPWDMKRLMRLIVTSATYRQSAKVLPEHIEKDARNRLIARMPRQRLEAEMVRDQALAASGLLSRKMFGPSVYPPQPEGMWQAAFNGERSYPTSKGEDRYRRGLYTFWRRTVPYPSMQTFDAPSREVCTIRRISTSTPLQAFVTLNDPAFVECSQALGRRLVKEGGATAEQRIRFGLKLMLNRPAADEQVKPLVALYESELAHYKQNEAEAKKLATEPLGDLPQGTTAAEAAAWTVVANVLLNLDGAMTR